VEIQQVLRAKNALLPENRQMEFRIGVNLGDVIEEGDTIYGDGVNIAARLEGLAEPGGICISGSAFEQKLAAAFGVVAIALLLIVDIGPPAPRLVPAPSYEQTLQRYQSVRGNNLVFAHIEGTWQATGRRMSGQFEILNAVGQSFIMLDRFTGQVFTAGRQAEDNLYVNQISLQTGPSASVKPVEVHLDGQRLAEALPILYQMQGEPGLELIYVSGDVIVPISQDAIGPSLQADYAQTSLRRVQEIDAGHYRLDYLTASELIELANVQVDMADLVFVAVYTHPETGPTLTPLPSPPATPGPAQ
jgi:hypothetical protein